MNDFSEEEIRFMNAMNEYLEARGLQCSTWADVLIVLESLGYTGEDASEEEAA